MNNPGLHHKVPSDVAMWVNQQGDELKNINFVSQVNYLVVPSWYSYLLQVSNLPWKTLGLQIPSFSIPLEFRAREVLSSPASWPSCWARACLGHTGGRPRPSPRTPYAARRSSWSPPRFACRQSLKTNSTDLSWCQTRKRERQEVDDKLSREKSSLKFTW